MPLSTTFNRNKATISMMIVALFILFGSCEKEVNVKLNSTPPQLVVEGFIENGNPPVVILTKSIGYFAKIDLSALSNNFVHGAKVTVSDGTRTIILKEYKIDTLGNNSFYFYTLDTGALGGSLFLGRTNYDYKLTVESEGKTYESTTRIKDCKPVDSMVAEAPNSLPDKLTDAMILAVYYSDPDTFGNCIRYFTKRNSEPFYPGYNSVYDDQIVNGVKSARIPIAAGFRRTAGLLSDSAGYVFKGDTVTLKWAAIDRPVFNFYNTYEYSLGTVGNPFSTPINVRSNISNGALGVWAGYGSREMTIIIPK